MEIGIMTYINCKHATVEEQFALFHKLGVHRTFLNGGHPRLGEIMNMLPRYDIVCDNFHSEFNGTLIGSDISMTDMLYPGERGDLMLERLFLNVLNCEKYSVPVLVVHTPVALTLSEICDQRFVNLGNFAKEHGVTLAFENICYFDNLQHMLNLLPNSKFCWDIGNQHIFGDRKHFVPAFGDKLGALHIHDNDLISDSHLIPFEGRINFEEATKELADSGYSGTMMLEILYAGQAPAEEYYTKAANAAKKLVEMVAANK